MKDAKLAPLHAEVVARLRAFRHWSARHVPRAENRAADALANEALDRLAAGGPAAVVRRPGDEEPDGAARVTGGSGSGPPPAGAGAPVDPPGRGSSAQPGFALEPAFEPADAGPDPGRLVVTILGSGTSTGVPRIACHCRVCTSADPRDRRSRASALLDYGAARVLIDAGPDLRAQALAAGIDRLDAVLITHDHADAIGGLDELRQYNEAQRQYLPVHARPEILEIIVERFRYAFEPGQRGYRGVPQLRPVQLAGPFEIAGRRFVPVPVVHAELRIAGYRTGRFAYLSDVQRVEPDGLALLGELDVLVVSALRDEPHPTHQTVAEALALIEALRPRRAILTHIDHDLAHAELARRLPAGVEPAVDGLVVEVAE